MELNQIKRLRREAGVTQAALAKRASVSQSLIAKVEAGRLDPSYSKAQQIFDALRTTKTQQEPTAGEIMEKTVYDTSPSESVTSVIEAMQKHSISQIPVIRNDVAVGLITESSLLHTVIEEDPESLIVEDVMEAAPPVVRPSTPSSALLPLLDHIPIVLVREQTIITGVVTKSDILQASF